MVAKRGWHIPSGLPAPLASHTRAGSCTAAITSVAGELHEVGIPRRDQDRPHLIIVVVVVATTSGAYR
jgi:hypothetical protein